MDSAGICYGICWKKKRLGISRGIEETFGQIKWIVWGFHLPNLWRSNCQREIWGTLGILSHGYLTFPFENVQHLKHLNLDTFQMALKNTKSHQSQPPIGVPPFQLHLRWKDCWSACFPTCRSRSWEQWEWAVSRRKQLNCLYVTWYTTHRSIFRSRKSWFCLLFNPPLLLQHLFNLIHFWWFITYNPHKACCRLRVSTAFTPFYSPQFYPIWAGSFPRLVEDRSLSVREVARKDAHFGAVDQPKEAAPSLMSILWLHGSTGTGDVKTNGFPGRSSGGGIKDLSGMILFSVRYNWDI